MSNIIASNMPSAEPDMDIAAMAAADLARQQEEQRQQQEQRQQEEQKEAELARR